MHSLSQALALVAICATAYYFGIYCRHYWLPTLSDAAVASIRFSCLPLMLVACIIMASQLNAAREGFHSKQRALDEMAALAMQLDRALTYLGQPAQQAQKDFREYIRYLGTHPDAMWTGRDRATIEPFAVELQSIPIPPNDTGVVTNTKKFVLDLMGQLSVDRYKLASIPAHATYAFTSALISLCLATIFVCVGLTSDPLSGTAFWTSLAVAICVGSMAFVTQEFDTATAGRVQVQSASFDRLLAQIGPRTK